MLFHLKMKVKLHSWKCRIFKRKEKVLLTIFFFETYFKTYFSTDTTASEGGSEKKRARKDVQPEGMRTPPLRVCFISHTLFFILYWRLFYRGLIHGPPSSRVLNRKFHHFPLLTLQQLSKMSCLSLPAPRKTPLICRRQNKQFTCNKIRLKSFFFIWVHFF